ncbi:unnamed protein product [Darwinula stevensoni]|uniref:Bestrophin homolog n=1 Tax=Darwinula stevensoni TaxID=69355 RepID=A0A7R8X394_9CRUS|nr:unnamed protein product [Darwinula stevensoni]CAG0882291.1 unnamed protein product [Darwinula stevensoni]
MAGEGDKDVKVSSGVSPTSFPMTIIYTKKVTTSGYYGGFFQFLCRWKGSVYKSVWKDVLLWLLSYYILRVTYTGILSEEGRKNFEDMVLYFRSYDGIRILVFLLGFYVSIVAGRWWELWKAIPWSLDPATIVATYLRSGDSEMALNYRLAIMRYIHLGVIICMQTLSTRAERHFGELEDLLDEQCPSCRSAEGKASHHGTPCRSDEPGYIPRMLTEEEKDILENLGRLYGSKKPPYWIPMVWACRLAEDAMRAGLLDTNLGLQSIISEIRGVRTRLGQCRDMENINIPLVYTQLSKSETSWERCYNYDAKSSSVIKVVTMGCYTWWIVSLIASQFIEQDGLDIYFPVFSVLQSHKGKGKGKKPDTNGVNHKKYPTDFHRLYE